MTEYLHFEIKNRIAYVYVIRAYLINFPVRDPIGYPIAIKIGWSSAPVERCKQLNRGTPLRMELIMTAQSTDHIHAKMLESYLHGICIDYRIKGEWFTPDALDEINCDALIQLVNSEEPHGQIESFVNYKQGMCLKHDPEIMLLEIPT